MSDACRIDYMGECLTHEWDDLGPCPGMLPFEMAAEIERLKALVDPPPHLVMLARGWLLQNETHRELGEWVMSLIDERGITREETDHE